MALEIDEAESWRATQMGSTPGEVPLEPMEQTTERLQHKHQLHKGTFLITGVGGGCQATR